MLSVQRTNWFDDIDFMFISCAENRGETTFWFPLKTISFVILDAQIISLQTHLHPKEITYCLTKTITKNGKKEWKQKATRHNKETSYLSLTDQRQSIPVGKCFWFTLLNPHIHNIKKIFSSIFRNYIQSSFMNKYNDDMANIFYVFKCVYQHCLQFVPFISCCNRLNEKFYFQQKKNLIRKIVFSFYSYNHIQYHVINATILIIFTYSMPFKP